MQISNHHPVRVSPGIQSGPKAMPQNAPDPNPDSFGPGVWNKVEDGARALWRQAREGWENDGWVYAAGAGLYAGIGTALGGAVGAPLVGAAKGLQIFGLQAGADAIMNNKTFEDKIFNWSNTMPAEDSTPPDLDYDDPKTRALFHTNLVTNAAVILSVPAAVGGILFGFPGALAVGALALVAAPLAEAM